MARRYVPSRGDAIWITLDPQAGHEQDGRRPALVTSPASYNGKVGLAVLCPITNQLKGYPFEVMIPAGLKVGGVVLSIKSNALIGGLEEPSLSASFHERPLPKSTTSSAPFY